MFVTRYLDIFSSHTLYLFFMKLLYLSVAGGIVYVLRLREPWATSYATQTANADKFPHWRYAVAPCAAIALFINEGTLFDDAGFFSNLPGYLVEVRSLGLVLHLSRMASTGGVHAGIAAVIDEILYITGSELSVRAELALFPGKFGVQCTVLQSWLINFFLLVGACIMSAC